MEDILQKVFKPLNETVFSGQFGVFQQDSAPAQMVKSTQVGLEKNVHVFIKADESDSSDLNPLDYVWPT